MTPMFRIAVPVLTLLLAVPGCSAQPFVPMAAPHASPVDRLVAQLEKEESRIEAKSRLIVIGAEGVPAMLAHTRHRSAVVRWELANILGPISDARALPALVSNTTADENPHVRWRSLWALSHFEPAAVVEALRAQLAEENELARWNAAMALSFFNIDDGLELIHAGVRNPDPWRRWEAINALGRIHDETSADIQTMVGVSRDVTERRRVERALSASEERYRLVSRATNDLVYDWDMVAGTVSWNDAITTAFQHPAHQLLPA